MGTHILLEAAKIRKITRFIHVSTDEVYGEVINGVSVLLNSMENKTYLFICSQIVLRTPSCHLPILTQQQKQRLNVL